VRRGDFTADTFDPRKRFASVLRQQGRVDLDADFNEQSDIFRELMRNLARDLIGPHGGAAPGFEITIESSDDEISDLLIERGHYYVDGILCANDDAPAPCDAAATPASSPLSYLHQPDYRLLSQAQRAFPKLPFQVYLDVWERFICAAEDDSIREVALGGPDTGGRTQMVWQVRLRAVNEPASACSVEGLWALGGGCLSARADAGEDDTDPCLCPPDARYRGHENQLYRVELHRGGSAWNGIDAEDRNSNAADAATFKWSRDNASVVFPVLGFEGSVVTLEYLGRDRRTDLVEGDLIEIEYEAVTLGPHDPPGASTGAFSPPPLLTVKTIDRQAGTVTVAGDLGEVTEAMRATATVVRRWDRPAGAPALGGEGQAADGSTLIAEGDWLELEDGVQVRFEALQDPRPYRAGDYWLIPARTATGDVIWPRAADGTPQPQAPRGVVHHYAPLGLITGADPKTGFQDCRCTITPLAKCPPAAAAGRPRPARRATRSRSAETDQ
jgi:hypothetical protein